MLMQEIDDQAGTGGDADDFPDGMYPLVRHLIRQSDVANSVGGVSGANSRLPVPEVARR